MDPLLSPADIRRLAAERGIRPTKRLGQNFVVDPNTVRRIVRAAELEPAEVVLEVGPGLGSLTLALLAAGHPVVAIEVDRALADALPATVSERLPDAVERLTVMSADAMSVRTVPDAAPTALVANLPYNVAVPVLLHLLATMPTLRTALVMVQSEVADRLVAAPGSRIYGVPSVKVAWWATATRAGVVPRSVFWPVPNVDSALVRLTRRDAPAADVDRGEVFRVVDAAFAQRRKSLRAALSGWAGDAATAEDLLRRAGIEPLARGESLGVPEFARLVRARAAVRSTS